MALPPTVSLSSLIPAAKPPLQHFVLGNGLNVYLQEDPRSPLACVQLCYHVGASHDPLGHTNLAHLLEHMLFEGSAKLAPGQFSRVIGRLGGVANASTQDDGTLYEVTLPAARLEVALEILGDTMANASLTADGFERAVKAINDERRLKFDNDPEQQAFEHHKRLAHGSSPYAAPSFGDVVDLHYMKPDTVRTWYRTWYHPNNATLVVVGNVDRARLQGWVERHFGAWGAAALPALPGPGQTASHQARQQAITLPGLRDGLYLSFNVPSLATAESTATAAALMLLPELLANGADSMLYASLVRERQVLTGIEAFYDHLTRGDTLLTLYAYSNPDKGTPQQAIEQIRHILDAVRQTPPSAQTLDALKFRLLTEQLKARDTAHKQAESIAAYALSGLKPEVHDQILQALIALTAEDIQLAAQRFLADERMAVTHMLAPPGAAAEESELPPLTCADLAGPLAAADFSTLQSAASIDTRHLLAPAQSVQAWNTANGSRVAFIARQGSPLFELRLRFNAGACQDGDAPGLAALTLYALDQGIESLDAQGLAARLSGIGASVQRDISHDHARIGLSAHCAAPLREAALELFTAMVARPALEAAAYSGIQARVLRYLQRRESSPAQRIDVEMLSCLFPQHAYGRDYSGTSVSVAGIDVDKVRAFHQRAYTAANLEITLVGDLSLTEARQMLDTLTQALPGNHPALPPPQPAIPLEEAIAVHLEQSGSNCEVTLALPLDVKRSDAEYTAMVVTHELLGAGYESRLVAELRERRNLTYSVDSHLRTYRAATFLYISWDIDPAYLDASVELVKQVIQCFIEHGPSQDELELAVNQLGGGLLRAFSDNNALASQLADLGADTATTDHHAVYLQQLAQLTPSTVQAAARRLLAIERCVCLSIGPRTEQKALPTLAAIDQ
ncbi:M16 family metallopeptidase [Pseudomonas sichuanensis]|uniref:Pitrilysin family protein n=1 Tax=Pseudomonas sichuanensis TaxID=2213015 RepID=A0ABV0DKY0_9PSED